MYKTLFSPLHLFKRDKEKFPDFFDRGTDISNNKNSNNHHQHHHQHHHQKTLLPQPGKENIKISKENINGYIWERNLSFLSFLPITKEKVVGSGTNITFRALELSWVHRLAPPFN